MVISTYRDCNKTVMQPLPYTADISTIMGESTRSAFGQDPDFLHAAKQVRVCGSEDDFFSERNQSFNPWGLRCTNDLAIVLQDTK
jgi:hypothetical protein